MAAADGIDYIQSQSTQGSHRHCAAEIELRREQSAVGYQLESRRDSQQSAAGIADSGNRDSAADSQFASAYLSFTSNILEPNEVTDYLVRLVQPRLTAIGGRAKSGHSWRPHLCHAHLDETGPDGCAEHQPVASPRCPGQEQFSRGRRKHKRFASSGQPDREHRFAHGRAIQTAGGATG